LSSEAPEVLVTVLDFAGGLRALGACREVNRAWKEALGPPGASHVFRKLVRSWGIPASLRSSVWQMLVLGASGNGSMVEVEGEGFNVSPIKLSPFKSEKKELCGGLGVWGGGGCDCRDLFLGVICISAKNFTSLIETGQRGQHSAVIGRDIPRAFGAVAPHKREQLQQVKRSESGRRRRRSRRKNACRKEDIGRSTCAGIHTGILKGRFGACVAGGGGGGGGGGGKRLGGGFPAGGGGG
ncbi:unnamed protein product, partial [Choristocarpus tenellus]